MKVYNDIKSVDVPVVDGGQLYIYVLENSPQGNIKIGKSTNMQQRLKALSGSNGGGNHIVKVAVSDVTYLYILERILHDHFDKARIDGTEWFDGTKVTFDEAVAFVGGLFDRPEYTRCNEIRRDFNLKHNKNIGD